MLINNADMIYLGSVGATKVYKGSNLVWESTNFFYKKSTDGVNWIFGTETTEDAALAAVQSLGASGSYRYISIGDKLVEACVYPALSDLSNFVYIEFTKSPSTIRGLFWNMENLQTVVAPFLEGNFQKAFHGCSLLKTVPMLYPDTNINNTFENCGLENIVMDFRENIVEAVDPFLGNSNVKTIEFRNCILSDQDNLFANMANLKTVTGSIDLSECGAYYLFAFSTALESIDMSAFVNQDRISDWGCAFRGCTSLRTITNLDMSGATSFGSSYMGYTFSECLNLSSDTIKEIFEALPDVSGWNNTGISQTGLNQVLVMNNSQYHSIITAKGWTIDY